MRPAINLKITSDTLPTISACEPSVVTIQTNSPSKSDLSFRIRGELPAGMHMERGHGKDLVIRGWAESPGSFPLQIEVAHPRESAKVIKKELNLEVSPAPASSRWLALQKADTVSGPSQEPYYLSDQCKHTPEHPTRLSHQTSYPLKTYGLSFSPSRNILVFRENGDSEDEVGIYYVDFEQGLEARRLSPKKGRDSSHLLYHSVKDWSPDGNKLYFLQTENLMGPNGEIQSALAAYWADFSSAGAPQIHRINSPGTPRGTIQAPRWSPDGRYLLHQVEGFSGTTSFIQPVHQHGLTAFSLDSPDGRRCLNFIDWSRHPQEVLCRFEEPDNRQRPISLVRFNSQGPETITALQQSYSSVLVQSKAYLITGAIPATLGGAPEIVVHRRDRPMDAPEKIRLDQLRGPASSLQLLEFSPNQEFFWVRAILQSGEAQLVSINLRKLEVSHYSGEGDVERAVFFPDKTHFLYGTKASGARFYLWRLADVEDDSLSETQPLEFGHIHFANKLHLSPGGGYFVASGSQDSGGTGRDNIVFGRRNEHGRSERVGDNIDLRGDQVEPAVLMGTWMPHGKSYYFLSPDTQLLQRARFEEEKVYSKRSLPNRETAGEFQLVGEQYYPSSSFR